MRTDTFHQITKSRLFIIATIVACGQMGVTTPSVAHAITLSEARGRLAEIEDEYETTSDQLEETERHLEELKASIEQTEGEITKKQESLKQKQEALAAMMSREYKQGKGSFVDILMSSETIDDLSLNMRYYNETSEADQNIISETKAAKAELDAKKGELEGQRNDEEKSAAELKEKSDDLARQQEEAQNLVDQLEEEERQRAIAAAKARLAAALAAQRAAAAANQGNGDNGDNGDNGGGGEPAPAPVPAPALNPGNAGIVDYAMQFVGTPYVYGGSSPSGFDCSGFVGYVWGNYGVSLPRSTYSMISWAQGNGTWTSDYTQLGAGDPVFTHAGHVLMVVSPSSDWRSMTVIHAPRPGRCVSVENIYQCPIGGIRLT